MPRPRSPALPLPSPAAVPATCVAWLDTGWLAGYLLAGAAAVVPSMTAVTEPAPDRAERSPSRRRLALLTGAVAPGGEAEAVVENGRVVVRSKSAAIAVISPSRANAATIRRLRWARR